MNAFRCVSWFVLSLPLPMLGGYGTDPDSGVYFNDSKAVFTQPADAQVYHGVKAALLISPEDIPERNHYSNSNMARLELYEVSPGGGARPHPVDGFREQVFIILKGGADFSVGTETLHAGLEDVVFVPPGLRRGFTAIGGGARILQAEWLQKGPRPEHPGRAYLTSERVRGLTPPQGEGYLTVTPNPRQHGNALSIISYGQGHHYKLADHLILYPEDMTEPRAFAANSKMARMGLEAYSAGGGTAWNFHPDVEQVFVILSGNGLFEIGANTIEVKRGDMVFAPRHVGHAYMTAGDKPFKFFEIEWGRP